MSVKDLRRAAGAEDVKQIRALLKADPDLIQDWKSLLDSCYQGRDKSVTALLDAGADPNVLSKTAHRHRPLHRVIEHKKTRETHEGHDRSVDVLLSGGADVQARGTHYRVTPLQLAAMGNETRFIPKLKKEMGRLDLFHCCVLGDDGGVERHLKKNPDLATTRDENGWPPMMYVAASKLHWSDPGASSRLVRSAEILIEAGAEANPNLHWGNWPLPALYFATGEGNHVALARLMLENGADPNDGESLHHSAEHLFEGRLELLIEYGGDLNKPGNDDYSAPLFFVLSYTSVQGVPWLLDHGADPNLKNGALGRTALHAAAVRGCNDKILQSLLDHGAKVNVKDREGATPLVLAMTKGKHRVAQFLETNGGKA